MKKIILLNFVYLSIFTNICFATKIVPDCKVIEGKIISCVYDKTPIEPSRKPASPPRQCQSDQLNELMLDYQQRIKEITDQYKEKMKEVGCNSN